MDTFRVVKSNWHVKNVPYMDTLSHTFSHMPSAEFTHLIICRDSTTVAPQRYTSSVLERLFRPGPGCKPSGWWIAAEAQDAEIKRCSSSPMHVTLRHVQADYSDKQIYPRGGGGKMEESVLFIIIKIWLFLCSPLFSPHAHIPPPQCWWSQLLKSAICSIIFNYPAIAASIIPLSSIVNRNHLLIDSKGQLEAGWKLKPQW